jgi:hypothetical protein
MRAYALIWAAAAGCAWGPGSPYGELTPELDVGWELAPERDAGDGWQRLASDYQIRVDGTVWATTKLVLIAGAEEEAEPAPALELPTGPLALIPDRRVALGCEGAPCPLGRGLIERVELEVTGLSITGSVRDGRTPPRRAQAAFDAAAPLPEPVRLAGALELPVDRASAPRIRLVVGMRPGAELFDAIDWGPLGTGPIDLAAAPAAWAELTAAVGEVELTLDVDRQ